MQAFAISVVLMSGACGGAEGTDSPKIAAPSATVVRHELALQTAARYDSGQGAGHVSPLSGRGRAVTSARR